MYKRLVELRYNFEECLEKKITIEGEISSLPWQHMIGVFEEFPFSNYLDLDNHEQIVIYTKEQVLRRNARIKVSGEIIKLKGKSKRPGGQESYFEYQMLVDNWNYNESRLQTNEQSDPND